MSGKNILAVRNLLSGIQAGRLPVDLEAQVKNLLAGCWAELTESNETRMEPRKVNRGEDWAWNPPVLSFTIARHGGTVLGSTRARLQHWEVNLDEGTTHQAESGFRQVTPTAPRVNEADLREIARRVCEAVQNGPHGSPTSLPIKWRSDTEVIIKPASLIPNDGFQQTIQGRRTRVKKILNDEMATIGWNFVESKGARTTYRRS